MARLPRLAVAGQPHLVLLRGLNHQPIALDDIDRRQCLAALAEAAALRQLAVHAYSLMDEHLLLLVTPPEASALSQAMQDLGRRYVAGFNRRHGRRGTLWDGRFRAAVVQPGQEALKAMLFIDTEAARASAGPLASDHAWCSAGHHLGRRHDPMITTLADYWQLGNTPFERESAYAKHLTEGLSSAEALRLAEASHKGWAVGTPAYLLGLAEQARRPVLPRPRGRPAGRTG